MYLNMQMLSGTSFTVNKISENIINVNAWKNAFGG